MDIAFEHGLRLSFMARLKDMHMHDAKQITEVFEVLEDYIEAVTRNVSPNVELKNIENLFLYFSIFLALVSFVFLFEISLLKPLKTFNRNLKRYLIILILKLNYAKSLLPRLALKFKLGKLTE